MADDGDGRREEGAVQMGEDQRDPGGAEPQVPTDVQTPLGTMFIVLLYGAGTVVLWGYMYYILLKSEGYLGGF